jgi:hypothetical protein
VPSAVIRGSNEWEDFGVTFISFPNWHIFTYLSIFLLFCCHSVLLLQCDTFMNVRLVTYVTLVTNINVMCHWSSNVS